MSSLNWYHFVAMQFEFGIGDGEVFLTMYSKFLTAMYGMLNCTAHVFISSVKFMFPSSFVDDIIFVTMYYFLIDINVFKMAGKASLQLVPTTLYYSNFSAFFSYEA